MSIKNTLKTRYMIGVILAFMPQLTGCLFQSLHIKGEADVEAAPVGNGSEGGKAEEEDLFI